MKYEYAFDATLSVAFRVKANSLEEAKAKAHQIIDGAEMHLWHDHCDGGDPHIRGEATLRADAGRPDALSLYETTDPAHINDATG